MTSSKSSPQDTREKILEAALDLFSTNGFHSTTTRKIAQKAGVNEVTLFRHFNTKMALFQEVVIEIRKLGFDIDLCGITFDIDPRDLICLLVEFAFDLFEKHPREVRLLTMALFEEVEGFDQEFVTRNRLDAIQIIADNFAKLQEQNRISSKESPDILAQMLLAQLVEMATQRAVIKSSPLLKYNRKQISDAIINLYLA